MGGLVWGQARHSSLFNLQGGSEGLRFCIRNEGDSDHTNHCVHNTLASMGGIMQCYFQDVLVLKHIRILVYCLSESIALIRIMPVTKDLDIKIVHG